VPEGPYVYHLKGEDYYDVWQRNPIRATTSALSRLRQGVWLRAYLGRDGVIHNEVRYAGDSVVGKADVRSKEVSEYYHLAGLAR
jgi:hypothetical protein